MIGSYPLNNGVTWTLFIVFGPLMTIWNDSYSFRAAKRERVVDLGV